MNWKDANRETPTKVNPEDEYEMRTGRLIIWIEMNGEGCAEFGIYSFYLGKFEAIDNTWAKHIAKGKATITNWDYINEPVNN